MDMEREPAMQLVRDAIAGGVFNDLGSGSNIDLCVITKGKVDFIRPYDVANVKGQKQGVYNYPPGTTKVLTEVIKPIVKQGLGTEVDVPLPMEQDLVQ